MTPPSRLAVALVLVVTIGPLAAAQSRPGGDTVSIRLVDTDLKAAIQVLGRYLTKPVIAVNLPAVKVTLETPRSIDAGGAARLLQGLVEAHGLVFTDDTGYYRVAVKEPPPPAPPPVAHVAEAILLHVVRLKHARAVDVAATIDQLFGGSGAFSGRRGLSAGTLGDELRKTNVPPSTADRGPSRPSGDTTRVSALNGTMAIVPDELTNSLFVRSSADDFGVVNEAIQQLDVRPLQVLIEVLIVEARSDKSFSLGADLFVPRHGPDNTAEATLTGGGVGDLVIQLLGLGKGKIDAVLRTAASRGQVDIVSRPVIVASNNTEARFLVGSQRPFVQVSRSLPTDTPTRDQVVQYKDVGTKLLVRPTINQDGYVSLLIQQEINAATSEVQFDAPVISTREASTQLLVRDGQTIVIGGLKDQQRERTQSGIPILSGIPIIGGLFGSARRHTASTELYLFLTPRILKTDEDADRVTAPRLPEGEHHEQ